MTDSALSFFLPRLDGSAFAGLQLLFALVFLAAAIAIPVLLRRAAQPAQWEQRLAAIEGADATTPTYHTVEELSQAVATAAERWADMLPGLLLVFGLLGTFIVILPLIYGHLSKRHWPARTALG
ncbi:MAG: hypothetical protein GAK35_01991 [Herbaspirillum frisingense]|uniref:Uncharacterized protein n=1 Tax=Herbaspirillum frisingense TaxID=92645 RepID=A0A7V8JUK1_9BURK|nr:MAG: hypothetical protein GAK35_01991 [Herbaspirillum frisingense]